ncbi:hypothetical protein LTR37_000243 [Vermiconidia calcicola]|uniref:Uncharacterized protein n=1 Tax=Vermiconidia calcicola TaxID=1690605 RepID=A0ACC3P1B8_9PEZI|nr:hypothetical protein LTR37_000243 [Vermiconidia calcicola]
MATAGVAPVFLDALGGCTLKHFAAAKLPAWLSKNFVWLCPEAAPPASEHATVIKIQYPATKTIKKVVESPAVELGLQLLQDGEGTVGSTRGALLATLGLLCVTAVVALVMYVRGMPPFRETKRVTYEKQQKAAAQEAHDHQVEELQQSLAAVTQQADTSAADNEKLEARCETLERENGDLERAAGMAKEESEGDKTEIQRLRTLVAEQEQKIKNQKSETEGLKKNKAKVEEKSVGLEQDKQRLVEESKQLVTLRDTAENGMKAMRAKYEESDRMFQEKAESLARLEIKAERFEANKDELNITISGLVAKSNDLESKLATTQQQLAHEQTTAARLKTETEKKHAAITAKSSDLESKLATTQQELTHEQTTAAQFKTETEEKIAAITAKSKRSEHRCGSLEVELKIEQVKTAGLEQAQSELQEEYEEMRGKRDELNAKFDVNADEAVEEAKAEIKRLKARLARECHCRRGGVDGGDRDDDDGDDDDGDESGYGSGGHDAEGEDSSDPSAGADPSGGQEEDPQDGEFPCDDAEQDEEASTDRIDSDNAVSVPDTAPSPPPPSDSPDIARSLQPSSLTGDGDPGDDNEDGDDDSGESEVYGPESGQDAEDGGNSDPLAEADPSGGQEEGLEGNGKPDHDGNPATKWPSKNQRRYVLRQTADQRRNTSMQAGASSSKPPTAWEVDQARALGLMPTLRHGAQASQSGSAGWSSTAATGSGWSNTAAPSAANTQPPTPPTHVDSSAPGPNTLNGGAPAFTPNILQAQAANRLQALAAGSGAPAPPGSPSQAGSSGNQATPSAGPPTTADSSQAGGSGPPKKPRHRGGRRGRKKDNI